jgi:DNA-binding NtrC family response regulator
MNVKRWVDGILLTDLRCAIETDLPVLITGRRDRARALARRIHQSGRRAVGPFVPLDAAEVAGGAIAGLWAGEERHGIGGTLMIEGIEELSASAQGVLADCLSGDGLRPWRVMATASPDLVRLVAAGRFDDRLFYRLNVIHLVVPEETSAPGAGSGAAGVGDRHGPGEPALSAPSR